jgi:hypothetical protein
MMSVDSRNAIALPDSNRAIAPFIKSGTADYPALLAQPDPKKLHPRPIFESLD